MKINIIFTLFIIFLILSLTNKETFTGFRFYGGMTEWENKPTLFPNIPSIFLPIKKLK